MCSMRRVFFFPHGLHAWPEAAVRVDSPAPSIPFEPLIQSGAERPRLLEGQRSVQRSLLWPTFCLVPGSTICWPAHFVDLGDHLLAIGGLCPVLGSVQVLCSGASAATAGVPAGRRLQRSRRPAVPRVHRPLVARRDHHDAPHPLRLPDPRRAAADPRQRPRGRGHDLGGVQLRAARDARAGARGARPSGRLPDRRPPGQPLRAVRALQRRSVHAVARRRRADGRGADGPASRAPRRAAHRGGGPGARGGRRGVLRGQQRARGHGIRARVTALRSASTCARTSPSRP